MTQLNKTSYLARNAYTKRLAQASLIFAGVCGDQKKYQWTSWIHFLK